MSIYTTWLNRGPRRRGPDCPASCWWSWRPADRDRALRPPHAPADSAEPAPIRRSPLTGLRLAALSPPACCPFCSALLRADRLPAAARSPARAAAPVRRRRCCASRPTRSRSQRLATVAHSRSALRPSWPTLAAAMRCAGGRAISRSRLRAARDGAGARPADADGGDRQWSTHWPAGSDVAAGPDPARLRRGAGHRLCGALSRDADWLIKAASRGSRATTTTPRAAGAGRATHVRVIHCRWCGPRSRRAILVFVDCLKELPATLLLRPLNVDTLATSIYQIRQPRQFRGRRAGGAADRRREHRPGDLADTSCNMRAAASSSRMVQDSSEPVI